MDGLGSAGSFIGGQLAQLIAIKSDIGRLATTAAFQTIGSLVGTEIRNRVVGAPDLTDTAIGNAFLQSATSAIGGYAGAQAGAALFKALGIDQTAGRLIGATVGAAVAATAAADLAETIGGAGTAAQLGLNTSLLYNLQSSLPSLGIAVFEQLVPGVDPANSGALVDANQENVQIGEAIGGAIGSIFNTYTFGGSTYIGQWIGAAIGSLFGHASVGANAGAAVGLDTSAAQSHQAWKITYRGSDNPDQVSAAAFKTIVNTANNLADAATALLNAETDVLAGGKANVGTLLRVGANAGVQVRLFKNPSTKAYDFYDEVQAPGGTTNFPSPSARDFGNGKTSYTDVLNDAVMRELALSTFTVAPGGDPDATQAAQVMVNALRNSMLSYDPFYVNDALAGGIAQHETLGQLNYDLQAVQDYDLFQQNKVAFLTGFALREYNQDQADQQQAMQDAQNGHPTTFTPRDVAADLEQDLARGGLLQHGYYWQRGQGTLTINNYATSNGGNEGFLAFAYGIKPDDVTLSRSGNDLVLTIAPVPNAPPPPSGWQAYFPPGYDPNLFYQGGQVVVQGAFADLQHALSQIQFRWPTTAGTGSTTMQYQVYYGPELTAAFPPGQSGPYPLTGFVFIGDAGAHTRSYSHNSIVVHADGAGLTNTGDGNTVVLTGKNGYLGLTGQGTTLTSNGNSDVASLSGDQARVVMNGIGDQLYLSGNSGTLTLNGGGGTVSMWGNSNTLTANGDGTGITVGGQDDKVAAGGSTITVGDWTNALLVTGANNQVRIGSHVSADMEAYATAVLLSGTSNTVTLGTQYGSLSDTGSGNTVLVNAQDTSVTIAGTNNNGATVTNATVNGLRNAVAVAGSGNTVAVNGQDNSVTLGGTGNTLGTAGNSISILDGTTGATLTGGGTTVSVGSGVQAAILTSGGEAVTLSGSNTTLQIAGGYGSTTITGQNDSVVVKGDGSKVAVAGALNAVTVSGYAAQVQVSGAAQTLMMSNATVKVADGAQVTAIGQKNKDYDFNDYSNGSRFLLGTGVGLSLVPGPSAGTTTGGGNNYVEASSNDTVSLNGAGNGVVASGAGNVVTLSGTTGKFGENGYARMGGSTLVLKAGGIATLTGDYDSAIVEAGATLHVAGTGDAVTASSATLSFDGPAQPALPASPLAVRGFGFPAAQAGDYDPASSAGSLAGLAATGANAVELVVTQFLTDLHATTISATGRTESDANLVAEIGAAHARGLQVLLKPHIDSETNEWRAYLAPSDPAQFFASYKAFIVHYAQIAQAAHADQFCIGAELQSLTGPAYRSQWLDIIQAVRAAYSGPITYASAGFETGGVSFWDKVDVIGANAYERVTASDNPSLAELEAGWQQPTPATGATSSRPKGGDPIDNQPQTDGFGETAAPGGGKGFYSGPMGSAPAGTTAVSPVQFYKDLSATYGKPVLFTEAGYASVNETNRLQGDGRRSGATYVDYQQQALATQAFLDVFTQAKGSWLQGAYLWYWNPNAAGVTADDSSVQDKPALDVVRRYYGATPASAPGAQSNAVSGDGNAVTLGLGQALTVTGNGNAVSLPAAVAVLPGISALSLMGSGNTLQLGVSSGRDVAVEADALGSITFKLGSGAQVVVADTLFSVGHGVDAVSFLNGEHWDKADLNAIANEYRAFDTGYYLAHNPDVAAAGVDPFLHYVACGSREGRNPSAVFDTRYYLAHNPDVAAAGADPLRHYEEYGWKEGREPSLTFSGSKYLAAYGDVNAAGLDPLLHYVEYGQHEGRTAFLPGGAADADPLVDAAYLDRQLGAALVPAGTAGQQQAAWRYHAGGGWQQGLNPDAFFDTGYYLAHNPDVAGQHIDPLAHYEAYGWKEGRNPSAQFSVQKYLAAYADVSASNSDPLRHYLLYGQSEGRQAFPV